MALDVPTYTGLTNVEGSDVRPGAPDGQHGVEIFEEIQNREETRSMSSRSQEIEEDKSDSMV